MVALKHLRVDRNQKRRRSQGQSKVFNGDVQLPVITEEQEEEEDLQNVEKVETSQIYKRWH